MAIRIERKKNLNAVEIISEHDDSLDVEKCDFPAYRKDYDRAHLAFLPNTQPTVFVCNFELGGKEAAAVKNSMLGGSDDDGKPQVALGSWGFRIVKLCLKDIRNPADVPEEQQLKLRKDDRGYVHDDFIAVLDRIGVANEIFAAYNAMTTVTRGNLKN